MVFSFAVLVFGILTIGPQVVLSLNFTFTLSEVKQCEPVSITIVGNSTVHTTSPTSLTLVPFNSTPVSIPISDAPSNISSVSVASVPFAAGTRFLASLDDASGENLAKVSAVVEVLPSPTGNATCLPKAEHTVTTRNFILNNSTFSQCENFTITYNHAAISRAPSIRALSPEGPSHLLNLANEDSSTETATYLLSFKRSKVVVLIYDDGMGHTESSVIMTVAGDSSSTEGCLSGARNFSSSTTEPNSASSWPSKLSMSIIIGASVGGGLVVFVAFCMLLFILRLRRRRRQEDVEFGSTEVGKEPLESQEKRSFTLPPGDDQGFVKDPPYTHDSRDSMASWSQPTPNDPRFPGRRYEDDDDVSLKSLDIEGMLNMAAVQSSRSSVSRSSTQIIELMPFGPTYPAPPHLKNNGSRQHIRDSSDVPFGPESMASAYSLTSVIDPLAGDTLKGRLEDTPPSPQSSRSLARSPPQTTRGLPTSPRDGPSITRGRRTNAKRTSSDSNPSNSLGVVLEETPVKVISDDSRT
ncbi:hypothetical protein H0H87_006804 [Tephrocybe sp. NHM501043]|nr:hypothetical protein H0H87_006804 [Tephrocybe sp. NHM501043]